MQKQLKLMNLSDHREYHLGQLCHKNIYCEGTASLSKFFKVTASVRNTRQRNKVHLVVPKHRTVMGSKTISVRGPKKWNDTPNVLKIIEKYVPFSYQLRSQISDIWDNHPTQK